MIDKAGCKIAEYAGDDNHTWQKQPEALLAHGVEPWSIGLQDHNDGHMPQIDPVLVPGYEVQRTQKPEIHFRQEGEAHKQYTCLLYTSKQDITTGISSEDFVEITDGIRAGDEVIEDLGSLEEGMTAEAAPADVDSAAETGETANE